MIYNSLSNKYTVELRYLHEDENYEVFDFDYEFYDDMLKPLFEELFIDHYYYREICCIPVSKWKRMLKSRLNIKAPYYKELYRTIEESYNTNFLLNKDLKETFIRDIKRDNVMTNESISNSNSVTDVKNSDITNGKESNIDNGLADISTEDKLTNVNENKSNSSSNQNIKDSSTSNNKANNNESEKEVTELISQGNIGTTSSGELLTAWRESILNLNEKIINDCRDLFMLIY